MTFTHTINYTELFLKMQTFFCSPHEHIQNASMLGISGTVMRIY